MKIRNSNFELLRIISMLMIIAHHYSVHGQFTQIYGISINNMIIDFLFLGGKIGVLLFVMITGYHMINSKINIKKIIQLEFQIIFYSLLITIFFHIFHFETVGNVTITNIVDSLMPITRYTYWFATIYMLLYLFIPYINKLLLSLSKKEYINLLTLGLFLFTLVPTFARSDLYVGNLIYFIYFYTIGAYFKLYPKIQKKRWCLLTSSITYLFIFICSIFFQYISSKDIINSSYIYHFAGINSLFTLIISISMFLFFKNLKIKNKKWINIISSTTFGIYLIHDNPYVRQFLWVTVFKNSTFYQSNYLFIHAIISIFVVFIISSLIELVRKYIVEKNTLPIIYKLHNKLRKD